MSVVQLCGNFYDKKNDFVLIKFTSIVDKYLNKFTSKFKNFPSILALFVSAILCLHSNTDGKPALSLSEPAVFVFAFSLLF